MFLIIFEPANPWIIYARRMGPREKLDAAKFAAEAADIRNREIDWTRTSFDGRGDIRVEFRKYKQGGFLHESQSYYFVNSKL